MAVQGIIKGFGNPQNLSDNVFLVGRGSQYHLYHNGQPVEGATYTSLEDATPAFDAKAKQVCASDWLEVRGVVGNNVNSHCTVDVLGSGRFARFDYYMRVTGGVIVPVAVAQALSREQADPEMFPGATPDEIGFVYLQDILGEYSDLGALPERAWLDERACFAKDDPDGKSFEVVVRVDDDLGAVPASLQAVFDEAREKVFVYVIFAHRQSGATH